MSRLLWPFIFLCLVPWTPSSCAPLPPPPSELGVQSLPQLLKSPSVVIGNGRLSLRVYLPDRQHGFYRGSRFDWAGIVGSLTVDGHDYYVPWFQAVSAQVRDYTIQGSMVVNSANNATGPAEEFNAEGGALGYSETPVGGLFLKIGVGLLRRQTEAAYDKLVPYPLVDPGQRTVRVDTLQVAFTHVTGSPRLNFAYEYTKSLRVDAHRPLLWIEHTLRNTGQRPIVSEVSNHNFLNIDGQGTTQGMLLSAPFKLVAERELDPIDAQLDGSEIHIRSALSGGQMVVSNLSGYGASPDDNTFCIADPKRQVGVRLTGDRPLSHLLFWSIRPVISIEPFIEMHVQPGESFSWSYRYEFGLSANGCESN